MNKAEQTTKMFTRNRIGFFLGMFAGTTFIVWIVMTKPYSQERDQLVEAEKTLIKTTRQHALAEMADDAAEKVGKITGLPNVTRLMPTDTHVLHRKVVNTKEDLKFAQLEEGINHPLLSYDDFNKAWETNVKLELGGLQGTKVESYFGSKYVILISSTDRDKIAQVIADTNVSLLGTLDGYYPTKQIVELLGSNDIQGAIQITQSTETGAYSFGVNVLQENHEKAKPLFDAYLAANP